MFGLDNSLIKSLRKVEKRNMALFKAYRQLTEGISGPENSVGTLNCALK